MSKGTCPNSSLIYAAPRPYTAAREARGPTLGCGGSEQASAAESADMVAAQAGRWGRAWAERSKCRGQKGGLWLDLLLPRFPPSTEVRPRPADLTDGTDVRLGEGAGMGTPRCELQIFS